MFTDLKNSIDFYIRNKTKFSRKNFVEKNKVLLERNLLENLYTKDILKQYLVPKRQQKIRILDIGCKNWFYARGEFDFFHEFAESIDMDGVEIDAYRLYSNFYSRYEVAKYHIKGLDGANYIAGDLLNLNKKYDYIIWFLPFVIKEPHIYWGLPNRYFYPEKLLNHAYSLLDKSGEMLIINQGKEETSIQKSLLEELKIPYTELGNVKSKHLEYAYDRYGFLVKKN